MCIYSLVKVMSILVSRKYIKIVNFSISIVIDGTNFAETCTKLKGVQTQEGDKQIELYYQKIYIMGMKKKELSTIDNYDI